jgi:hypothetical protein
MATQNKPKILHFSHALYNKASYSELNMHDTGSLQVDHKLILGDEHYQALCSYYKAGIEEQRAQLTKDEKAVVEAHVHAIVKLDNHKAVLAYALPSLDGILFGIVWSYPRKT